MKPVSECNISFLNLDIRVELLQNKKLFASRDVQLQSRHPREIKV